MAESIFFGSSESHQEILASSFVPTQSSVQFLQLRLADLSHPVRLLVMGPFTNIGIALRSLDSTAITDIVTMGGAVEGFYMYICIFLLHELI